MFLFIQKRPCDRMGRIIRILRRRRAIIITNDIFTSGAVFWIETTRYTPAFDVFTLSCIFCCLLVPFLVLNCENQVQKNLQVLITSVHLQRHCNRVNVYLHIILLDQKVQEPLSNFALVKKSTRVTFSGRTKQFAWYRCEFKCRKCFTNAVIYTCISCEETQTTQL